MFQRRSRAAFLAAVFGAAYAIYSLVYWTREYAETDDTWASLGVGLAVWLVLPHVIATCIAVIPGFIGFFNRSTNLLLTAAISYSVAAILFPLYAAFLAPSVILGFVGYSAQKKINSQEALSDIKPPGDNNGQEKGEAS